MTRILRDVFRKVMLMSSFAVIGAVTWFVVEHFAAPGYGWPATAGFFFSMLMLED